MRQLFQTSYMEEMVMIYSYRVTEHHLSSAMREMISWSAETAPIR